MLNWEAKPEIARIKRTIRWLTAELIYLRTENLKRDGLIHNHNDWDSWYWAEYENMMKKARQLLGEGIDTDSTFHNSKAMSQPKVERNKKLIQMRDKNPLKYTYKKLGHFFNIHKVAAFNIYKREKGRERVS